MILNNLPWAVGKRQPTFGNNAMARKNAGPGSWFSPTYPTIIYLSPDFSSGSARITSDQRKIRYVYITVPKDRVVVIENKKEVFPFSDISSVILPSTDERAIAYMTKALESVPSWTIEHLNRVWTEFCAYNEDGKPTNQ